MIKNYFTTAVRNLLKNRMYTCINISGFTIGLVCWIFILGYTNHEMSYDGFHPKKDRIYRVIRENKNSDLGFEDGASGALGPALVQNVPEIEQAVRLLNIRNSWLTSGDKGFYHQFCLTDPEFPKVFSLTFITGNAITSLTQPYGILISQSTARRFFGSEDPIGKTISSGDRYSEGDYIVTGVFKDWPSNSTIQFDCLTATRSPKSIASWAWTEWKPNDDWHPTEHYVLLKENVSPQSLTEKLQLIIVTYMGNEASQKIAYHLQPLSRIHLYSKQDYNFPTTDSISQIYILYTIGLFIMTLICINFINFATALSYQRAKEIGMRKVVGARRVQLALQFLWEPLLLSLIALCIAWIFVTVISSFLDIGSDLTLWPTIGWSIILSILSGFCGGIYPALLASQFSIAEIFQAKIHTSKWHARKILSTFQLVISIGIFISTIIVYEQLTFIETKELGFDKEAVLVMPIFQISKESRQSITIKYPIVEEEFKKHPDIIDASASNHLPGTSRWRSVGSFQLIDQIENVHHMRSLVVTQSFLKFYGIELLEGRNFTAEEGMATAWTKRDHGEVLIINQTAAKKLGLANPIGQKLKHGRFESEIIGLVKDFHTASLHDKIEPIAFTTLRGNLRGLSLRIRTENMAETMAFIEETWYKFIPHRPFEYFFLDDFIDQQYQKEKQLKRVLNIAITISLLVTCIGILGMIALSVEQRKKEIGIRKVLGASISNLVILLSKDTAKHLIIANIITWPIVYYLMQQWLQDFAYQITLNIFPFFTAFAIMTTTILTTISTQAIKAARKNPVETLRYE